MVGSKAGIYDVLVVGGGPAGSTCARMLTDAGMRVAIVDRAEFPRVKLCAGWLSPPFWDAIGRTPREYPRGLWQWQTCYVHYRGKQYAMPGRGYFIRRYELDEWLLRESGADLILGKNVKDIVQDGDEWRITVGDQMLVARYLVGAGGTHCPVARLLAPTRPRRAVGVQELELQPGEAPVERTRLGDDGEPELVLFDDLSGYGWNVPKHDWINVGCGTLDATIVRGAWQTTHTLLRSAGHIPVEAEAELEHMKGHSYFLFDPIHLDAAAKGSALLVGDSLGLAHPLTAEGIVPAVTSARHAARAILASAPESYPQRLRDDALLADYRRTHRVVEAARALRAKRSGNARPNGGSRADRFVARGFAWMFSGARIPAPRVVDFLLDRMPKQKETARHAN